MQACRVDGVGICWCYAITKLVSGIGITSSHVVAHVGVAWDSILAVEDVVEHAIVHHGCVLVTEHSGIVLPIGRHLQLPIHG